MFQHLPGEIIADILVKAASGSRLQMSKLPRSALTCRLFYVLTLESIEQASTDDINNRLHLLACSKKLTSLVVKPGSMDDVSLAALVRHFSGLTALTLGDAHAFPTTLAVLQTCPQLRTIRTWNPDTTSLAALAAVPTLAELFVQADVGTLTFREAAQTLTPCTTLQRLEWNKRIASDPMPLLALTGLTRLLFRWWDDPNRGTFPWEPDPTTEPVFSPNLRELVITGTPDGPTQAVWQALRSSAVHALWLWHHPPPDVLLSMPSLSALTIQPPPSFIRDSASEAVERMLRDLRSCLPQLGSLAALHLVDWDRLKDEVLERLLGVLPDCRHLQSLKLSRGTNLTVKGVASLCTAMMENAWQKLELSGVRCEKGGVELVQAFAARRGVELVL